MVTGNMPFMGENAYAVMNARLVGDPVAPRSYDADIPAAVEEIILHAMARDPAARYPSTAAMKAEVDDPSRVELAGRASRLQVPRHSKTRWRAVRVALLAILVPIALFFLFFLMLKRR